jgi:hypothetical protein
MLHAAVIESQLRLRAGTVDIEDYESEIRDRF